MNGTLATAPMLGALDRLHTTGVEYGGYLSNHGPMAADAMIRLGGADRVERWVEMYRVNLEPALPPRGAAVGGDDWQRYLGNPLTEGDWAAYFQSAIAGEGWCHVLATWWPRLLPGAAAGAAHGLLRTAHAVRNLADGLGCEPLALDELGAGLSLWASRYQELPGAPGLGVPADLATAVAGLPRLDPGVRSRGPGITGRLDLLFDLDGFAGALDAWGPNDDIAAALDELIGHAARVVLARDDAPIVYCHAVTAPAAVRMILPHVPEALHRATLAACWQLVAALLAAFATRPDPPLAAQRETIGPEPEQLALAAIEHGDEHVLKLAEACIRQFDLTGDGVVLAAADAFRHRIQPFW